jgi:hypothetical protein
MYGIMIVRTHLLCLDGQEEIHTGPDVLDKKRDHLCSSGHFIRIFPKISTYSEMLTSFPLSFL